MSIQPRRIKVGELLSTARSGMLDVPEFHRAFAPDRARERSLLDSLARQIPVGPLLLWESRGQPPAGGRYRAPSSAPWWILDGQQRVTGLLAAFGVQPDWIPGSRWAAVRGPQPPVSFTAGRAGHVAIAGARRQLPQVPLHELHAAYQAGTVRETLAAAGIPVSDQVLAGTWQLLGTILDTWLYLEWVPGSHGDACLAWTRRHTS